ncbi:hypothetical protein JYB88_09585 [Shewanella cyperi]|uniref:Uncharacterized protein n=1 Tax=Shewanella cyperi TaxID=2814292 RepID=A0A974XKA4_9GAMM|nr:hypothetical protein [Shewanella cyperi]QSX28556.1 hypothetical protein JYB88_09585 [Shewanella cyperi]
MSFNLAFIPIGLLFLVAVPAMFITLKLLSKEVSRERLNQIEDLSSLWKNSFPPKGVLTDKGLSILKLYKILLVITLSASVIAGLFLGFSNSPITLS